MRRAKADTMNGVPYTLFTKNDDMIAAIVDPYNNTFSSWESAEKWVARIIKEKRLDENRRYIKRR